MTTLDDLAVKAQTGGEQAFAELFREFNPRLRIGLARRVRNAHLIDDLAAAAWEAIWTGLSSFDPARGDFGGWAYVVARNAFAAFWHQPYLRREVPLDIIEPLAVVSSESAETWAMRRWTVAQVRRSVAALPSPRREVVELHGLHGRTFAEVAARQGVAESTTKARYARARRDLAEPLRDVA
jgi:RNA polymerase sigma-70 factor (ECF subfamily)